MKDNMTRRAALGVVGTAGLAAAAAAATALLPSRAPAAEKEERRPHIRAALKELKEARKELEEADHDFDGHRKEAVEAIDGAIKQLKICLEHDKK